MQIVAYEMKVAASSDTAMVLPIPVTPGCAEDAVKFIDMSSCPDFFDFLGSLFPSDLASPWAQPRSYGASPQRLQVVRVGSFEASFVPTIADFSRLDERFRITDDVWAQLPGYEDFGFAVFKLRANAEAAASPPPIAEAPGFGASPSSDLQADRTPAFVPPPNGASASSYPAVPPPGNPPVPPPVHRPTLTRPFDRQPSPDGAPEPHPVHPMAFAFPTRHPNHLFFPTVHVHDGKVHAAAEFDHQLFCQAPNKPLATATEAAWESSYEPAPPNAKEYSAGVLEPGVHAYRVKVVGERRNGDAYLDV